MRMKWGKTQCHRFAAVGFVAVVDDGDYVPAVAEDAGVEIEGRAHYPD